jgi:3-oxoacyl-[acyl-carrier protein] reductase
MARELGPQKITVNTIAPGRIDTPRLQEVYAERSRAAEMEQIPLRRFGRAEEVADVICFLASDRASYVSGAVIPVDGGMTRSLL